MSREAAPDAAGEVRVCERYDLHRTLGPLRRGARDPVVRFTTPGEAWRATRTPEGTATGRYRVVDPGTGTVAIEAWGDGARWLVEHAPALLGATDDAGDFATVARAHPLVDRLHRATPGLRIPRTQAVYEALLPVVLEQKVTGLEAKRSWFGVLARWGEPAPGPGGLQVPPAPEVLAAVAYHELHPLGVERKRAETLRAVARHARRLEEATAMAAPEAHARLRAVPGVGAWSAAEVALVALGDADAVSVGDYHLPHEVSWALAGERVGSDRRMLELLAPFAPHRGRVVRLLAGRAAPRRERRGPRLVPERNHRR